MVRVTGDKTLQIKIHERKTISREILTPAAAYSFHEGPMCVYYPPNPQLSPLQPKA